MRIDDRSVKANSRFGQMMVENEDVHPVAGDLFKQFAVLRSAIHDDKGIPPDGEQTVEHRLVKSVPLLVAVRNVKTRRLRFSTAQFECERRGRNAVDVVIPVHQYLAEIPDILPTLCALCGILSQKDFSERILQDAP
jgi:hypothetical protein